jgi:tRNA-dihydrouridine synthase C
VTVPEIQLAPMEGVLDWVLRELLSEVGGLDRMVTEFVRVTDKLLPDHVFYRYAPELHNGGCTRRGVPVFVQLLGGQSDPMATNAARVVELGALGVDLNFGCPAKTVNRHDGGAALLKEPSRIYEVTRAVRAAVAPTVPVTAKVRLGFDHKDFHREIACAVHEAKADHIVVHARTKAEMYTPPAHWEYLASMQAAAPALPFLANGEIWSVEDYRLCRQASGLSRVALGRGLVRRPWLARAIRAEMALAASSVAAGASEVAGASPADEFDRLDFLWRFFEMSRSYRGETYALARLKQILRYWSPADAEALAWFNHVKLLSHPDDAVAFLRSLFVGERREKENSSWSKFKFIPGPIAPTACAPRIC